MKKLFLLAACGLIIGVMNVQAQQKIGYANVDYIFSEMPESKEIESKLQTVQTQLKKEMDTKAEEFRTKLKAYNDNINEMLPAVRANTERELQQLQQNLQKLQEDAQVTIQEKQEQLMLPVYDKVGKAIEAVAKENGFNLILTGQVGGGIDVVLYGDQNLDTSDLILKKMGVTPKPKAAAGESK